MYGASYKHTKSNVWVQKCSRSIGMPKRGRGRGRDGARFVIGGAASFTQEFESDNSTKLVKKKVEKKVNCFITIVVVVVVASSSSSTPPMLLQHLR